MTTNYGERPGIIERGAQGGPRTMSAKMESDIRRDAAAGETRFDAPVLLAELDAERAAHGETMAALADARTAHARTLAALERIAAIAHHLEAAGAPDLPNADRWRIVAECREVFAENRPKHRTRLLYDSARGGVRP